jgi:hypothetical protein
MYLEDSFKITCIVQIEESNLQFIDSSFRVLGPNSAGKKKVFSKLFTTQVLDIVQN